jgi:hypothetical protein
MMDECIHLLRLIPLERRTICLPLKAHGRRLNALLGNSTKVMTIFPTYREPVNLGAIFWPLLPSQDGSFDIANRNRTEADTFRSLPSLSVF